MTKGLDSLDGYFARYLPQLALAAFVPVVVLARVAGADLISALTIGATVPLIPVFMILVGMHTRARTERQWRAAGQARRPLPRRRRGPADAEGVRPGEGSGGDDPQGQRQLPPYDDGAPCGSLSCPLSCSSCRHARHRAGCGRGRAAPAGRPPGLPDRAARPAAHARGLPSAARGRREFHASADGVRRRPGASRFSTAAAGAAVGAAGPPAAGCPTCGTTRSGSTGRHACYPGRGEPALGRLNLTIGPGERVAITGPSGAGKSPLLALLLGSPSRPEAGSRVGRHRPGASRPTRWRGQIAWVPQQPGSFAGTVADNIGLGRPAAPDDIGRAAALAGAEVHRGPARRL